MGGAPASQSADHVLAADPGKERIGAGELDYCGALLGCAAVSERASAVTRAGSVP